MDENETPTVERLKTLRLDLSEDVGDWQDSIASLDLIACDYLTLHAEKERLREERDAARAAYLSTQEKVLFEYERAEKVEAETQRLREEHAHVREILQAGIDRDKGDESAVALAAIASNAIYWRDREIARLRAEKEQQRVILAELVDGYERTAANLGGPKAHSYAEAMSDVAADLRALVDPSAQEEKE